MHRQGWWQVGGIWRKDSWSHRLHLGHRVGEPAGTDGANSVWVVNGKKHRVDGPSFQGRLGDYCWMLEGKPHRIEGLAYYWGAWALEGSLFVASVRPWERRSRRLRWLLNSRKP